MAPPKGLGAVEVMKLEGILTVTRQLSKLEWRSERGKPCGFLVLPRMPVRAPSASNNFGRSPS